MRLACLLGPQSHMIHHFSGCGRALSLRLVARGPIGWLRRVYSSDHERGGVAGTGPGCPPSGRARGRGRATRVAMRVRQPTNGMRDQDRALRQGEMHFLSSLFDEACPIGGGVARVVLNIVVNRGGGRGEGRGGSKELGPGFRQLPPVSIKGVASFLLPETLFCLA